MYSLVCLIFISTLNRSRLVYQSLEGKAARYNETAAHLVDVANYWQLRSESMTQAVTVLNNTAERDRETANEMKEKAINEEEWAHEDVSEAERVFATALDHYKMARLWATLACWHAFCVLIPSVIRVVSQAVLFVGSLSNTRVSSRSSRREFWRTMSYWTMHAVIFVLCLSAVAALDSYAWGERAAMISWFACIAAIAQTLVLHTVPHVCLGELTRNDVYNIVKHSTMRFVFFYLLFGLEFLFLWVNFKSGLQMAAVSVNSWHLRILGLAFLVAHVSYFEPRSATQMISTSGSVITVTLDDGSSGHVSETSRLTGVTSSPDTVYKTESSGPTATAFLTMDLTALGDHETVEDSGSFRFDSFYSLDSSSPYRTDVATELQRIGLVFDSLVASCLVQILIQCTPLAWRFALIFGMIFWSLVCLFFIWYYITAVNATKEVSKGIDIEMLDV
jgi:hypothetical protein